MSEGFDRYFEAIGRRFRQREKPEMSDLELGHAIAGACDDLVPNERMAVASVMEEVHMLAMYVTDAFGKADGEGGIHRAMKLLHDYRASLDADGSK